MRASILTLVLVLLAAAPVHAQSAATLKQQGIAAARAKDWETARARFEAAYKLDPQPLTLYNLAAAQEQTDRLIAARASFVAFLERALPGDNPRFRALAKEAIAKLDKDIPTIAIRLEGFTASVVVELDGRALPPSALAAPLQLDPGEHVIVASRGAEQLARREIMVSRGARQHTVLIAPPPAVVDRPPPVVARPNPATPRAPAPGRAKEGGVLSSGWFWLATSVVVLGAAGAGYYYVIADAPVESPTPGTLGAGVLTVP